MARITKTIFLTAAEAATYKSTGTCQHVTPDGDTITVSDTDTDCIVYCPEDEPITRAELAEAVKHHYSTTEQVVGTWQNADGTRQPLYRRTIVHTVNNRSWDNTIEIPNEYNIVKYDHIFKLDNGEDFVYYYTSFQASVFITIKDGKHVISPYFNRSGASTATFYITIYYTKTTDTAS